MRDDFNKEIKDEDYCTYEELPSIHFRIRGIRRTINLFTKLCLFISVIGISTVILTGISMRYKYNEVMKLIEQKIQGEDMIFGYSEIINKVSNSLVTIGEKEENLKKGTYFKNNSTGIIIDKYGKILTSYSNIKNVENIYVKLPINNSEPVIGKIIMGNEDLDIAIIQVNFDEELTPINFSNSEGNLTGKRIALISNAVGDDYIDSIIPGIVTSTNRNLTIEDNVTPLLELNTNINEINSSGAIVNNKGELIGVASYKITKEINREGLYYGLGLNVVKEIINSVNEIKDMLGIVEGGFVNNENNSNVSGFYVERIEQDSNAYKSGLRPTDIIISIENTEIKNISDLYRVLNNNKDKKIIKCDVLKYGEIKEIEIRTNN